MSKFIFVTGGVVSGLGKGITAASLGRLLKQRGYKVTIQKFDPYINVDPGTMGRLSSQVQQKTSAGDLSPRHILGRAFMKATTRSTSA